MKIRLGFVSNSSSSSFLIAFKPSGRQQEEPNFGPLMKKLGIDEKSPFHYLVNQILGRVWYDGHEFNSWKHWLEHKREWYKELPEKEAEEYKLFEDEPPINVRKLLESGWIVKEGSIQSCEHLADFHHVSVNYQDDKLIFKHQGGH